MSLERDIGTLMAGMDALRDELRAHIEHEERWQAGLDDRLKTKFEDHSKRLRALERWRAWILGALAALAGAWAVIKAVIIGRTP